MANLAMTSKLPDQTALAGGMSADQFAGQTEVVTDPDMLVHGFTIRQWSEDWLKALATPDAARRLVVRVLGILAIVGLLNGPSPSAGAAPDTPTTPPPPPPQTLTPEAWHKSMVRKPAPTAGCYTSSYPSTDWQKVPCSTTAPQVPHPVNGYLSKVPGSISSATGSFYSVTDANCELNVPLNVTGVTCTSSPTTSGTLNAFSLQLNTNGYLTGLCPNNLECSGQQ
jgi:hypothetical protein